MIKKIIYAFGIIIVLFFAAAITLPIIYKDDIIAKVKSTINESVNADVSFGDFNVSLIRSFPNLSFSMENLMVVGVDSFKNDTMANIQDFKVVVDLMSVINGGTIKIKSLDLNHADLKFKVLQSGKANWDIAKADTTTVTTTDTAASNFKIALKSYSLKNSSIVYDDKSLTFYTALKNVNHSGSGDFTQDLFTLLTKTEADELTVGYGGVNYLSKVKVDADAAIDMNMKDFVFTFKDNVIHLNDLLINFAGMVAMPDTNIDLDLTFDAQKSEFKNFLSLVPALYSSSFDKLTANGKFALKGYYKGRMNAVSMPGFGLNVLVENGSFKYPDLPTGVNNVQLQLNVEDKDGVFDHTVVDMKKLHVEFGAEPFDAVLLLKTPESDPDIATEIKGTIDLANILKIVPLEGTTLSGIIKADMMAKGKMSTIEKGNYESFDAKGNVSISNLKYSSKESPLPLSISNASFNLSPKNIAMNSFSATYGKSDFSANGTLENYLAYALKGAPIKARLTFNAKLIDLNEMMGPASSEEKEETTTDTLTLVEIPANIDFVLNSSISKVLYDNMELSDIAGAISIKDKKLSFDKVGMKMLDGTVQMDGYYTTQDITKPEVKMNFAIQDMDIQKSFKTFNTVQKLAPIAENTSGKFSTTLQFNSLMGNDMSPVLSSTEGAGTLELIGASVKGSPMLIELGNALKSDKFKELNIKNTMLQFTIENGRVNVKPFDLNAGIATLNIGGSSGLDQTIDYVMKLKLPKNFLGNSSASVLSGLTSKLNSNGANYSPADAINVNALVGGLMSKPTVKLSMADMGANIKNAVKDVLTTKKNEAVARGKEEAKKRADQILAAAQVQADAVKVQARKLADITKQEGYAAADKLVSSASNPVAKTVAKKLADKAKKETDEKCAKIIAEGDKKADDIMAKARAEAAKLIG
jgi:hypothetical protein